MNTEIISTVNLGDVCIVRNKRAKRFIFRVKESVLYATVPFSCSVKDITKVLEDNSNRLKTLLQKSNRKVAKMLDFGFRIDAPNFKFEIVKGPTQKFIINHSEESIQLIAPPDTNFSNSEIQQWLIKAVEQLLLKNAKRILPRLVMQLSKLHNLKVSQVKLNLSKGRWGSCSSRGNINLSAFLLLLPNHLINAVILHELTHLTEMNHSDKFWSLLDSYSHGNALAWNKELKSYKTSIF